jgi:hypothetical protein
MATVTVVSPVAYEISAELSTLGQNDHIQGVCSQWLEDTYVVWVGIRDDHPKARRAAYQLEDEISSRHPRVLFDFHVIALPEGKNTQDYVSGANVVFQRSA